MFATNIKGRPHGPKRDYAGAVITQQETSKITATMISPDDVLLRACFILVIMRI